MKMTYYSFLNNKDKRSLMNCETINEKESIVICRQKEYREYKHFRNFLELSKELNETKNVDKCFYEVIFGNNDQKPYFDIDITDLNIDHTKLIMDLKKNILEKYPMIKDKDILVFNSHTTDKISYHVIVDRWILPSYEYVRQFFDIVTKDLENKEYIDKSMYKSIQQFRLYGSCKFGKKNYKVLDKMSKWEINLVIKDEKHYHSLLNRYSLVQNTSYCSYLPYDLIRKREFNDISNISDEIIEKIILIVVDTFNKNKDIFEYTHYDNSFVNFRRLNPSFCECCQRVHDNENAYARLLHNGEVVFNCRRSKKDLCIGSIVIDCDITPLLEDEIETPEISPIDFEEKKVPVIDNNLTIYEKMLNSRKERENIKKEKLEKEKKMSDYLPKGKVY